LRQIDRVDRIEVSLENDKRSRVRKSVERQSANYSDARTISFNPKQ
jgi:hypothetical protein